MAPRTDAVPATLKVLAGVFGTLALGLALFRFLDADELEHLHATWLVMNGQVPFRDFFEHHHPLVWFVLAPVLALTGESPAAILVFRILFFVLTLAIARATYLLAVECTSSKDAARLAAVLLLSMTTFVGIAIEIRPDVPQILFAVVSVLYALRLLRTGGAKEAVLCGSAAALSFLFLQKAVFVFAGYPVFFLYYVRRGRLTWRSGAWFTAAFAATCVPALAYLVLTGSFDDYVISNWLVNAGVGASGHRITLLAPEVLRDTARNLAFWILVVFAASRLVRRPFERPYAVPFWLGMIALGLIVALNRVTDRYLAATVPLLAVGVAGWLGETASRARFDGRRAMVGLALIVLVPATGTLRNITRTNATQLEQIRFVLDRTTPTDRVYDFDRNINVFRPGCHYYWFRVGPAPRLYREYSGGRRQDLDVCRALSDARPAFVYRRRKELETCGLTADYRPTSVQDLFVRRDHAAK